MFSVSYANSGVRWILDLETPSLYGDFREFEFWLPLSIKLEVFSCSASDAAAFFEKFLAASPVAVYATMVFNAGYAPSWVEHQVLSA
jgi:hypothetical protein